MKLLLPSGSTYGYDNQNKRVCTGSMMGRSNILPFQHMGSNAAPIKLHMERLQWVDGDYDQKGAYWGRTKGDYIYAAYAYVFPPVDMDFVALVFVRAKTRSEAKRLVREHLPNAKFYN